MQSPTIVSEPAGADQQRGARAPDRTDRYLERLDQYLESLATVADRIEFLSRQEVAWIARYNRFATEAALGTYAEPPGDDPPQASDYICTITAIAARKAELEGAR